MRIVNKVYNINDSINKTIVLISDIHYYDKTDIKHLHKLLNRIKKINPDYICIPGDITDYAYIDNEELLIDWFKELSTICKVIISIGNHEFQISRTKKRYGFNKELNKKLKSINNVYVLDNDNVVIDNINFIGLTLPFEHYYYNKESLESFNKYLRVKNNSKNYSILLCHSPFNVCNKEIVNKLNVDLILCGHTHGGIIPRFLRCIIKNSGLISPNKKLFPKNVYGSIKIDNTNIIITSGISVLPKKFGILRHLLSSEVAIIK